MKRLVALILLFLTISVGKGYGEDFWVGSVYDGTSSYANGVMTFDWSSSGSGVSVGAGPFGTPLAVGQTFPFRYQGYLMILNDTGGQTVAFPGLNTSFEYTVVAEIPEVVIGVVPFSATVNQAIFRTLPGGVFSIYAQTPRNTDVLGGSGFDDGTLVASGTIAADQISTFTADTSPPPTGQQGVGSFTFTGSVDYVNPAYLIPATISGFRVEGTINYPPNESSTTAFFAGGNGLPTYTVAANDLVLKVDASSKFIMAPLPPGDCRVTAGGVKDGLTVPCALNAKGVPDPKTCAATEFDTWGGQAGAQPTVDGNWTHHHVVSPKQSFLFHSNSLFHIGCSDPGCCVPACANAEEHQIDFAGIGKFNNQKGYAPPLPGGDLCFEVHLEDIGEPGPGGKWPSSTTPCTHCPGTPIVPGDCMNCTDYYEILIYDSAAHDATGCLGNVIYYNGAGSANCSPGDPNLRGYFTRSGNVQMHPGNN